MSLVEAVTRDYLENWLCPLDVAFWRAGSIFHQWQHLREQTLYLAKGNTVEKPLMAERVGGWLRECDYGIADSATCLPWCSIGIEVMHPPTQLPEMFSNQEIHP